MPCLLFDCGLQSKCSNQPLNPCGIPMTNPFIRASALWFNQKYGNAYSAANPWVCNGPCLYNDYRVPGCCLPRKNYRIYHPEKRCCDDYSSHHRSHGDTSESHHHNLKNKWYDEDSCSSSSFSTHDKKDKKDKKDDKKDKKNDKKDKKEDKKDNKKDDKKDKSESRTTVTSKSVSKSTAKSTGSESYSYTYTDNTTQ